HRAGRQIQDIFGGERRFRNPRSKRQPGQDRLQVLVRRKGRTCQADNPGRRQGRGCHRIGEIRGTVKELRSLTLPLRQDVRSPMKRMLIPSALMMLCVGLVSAPAADEKINDSPYYPLKIGTKWQYRAGMATLVLRVTKYEKVGAIPCAVVEVSRDDKVVATDYVGMQKDGVYRVTMQG